MIIVLTIIGVIVMVFNKVSATGLTATGFENLKFYTVLSNVFSGIVAVVQSFFDRQNKRYLSTLKLTAASAVSLTLIVVGGFFGPLYGWSNFYHGSNIFFHLIVPLLCMAEYLAARHEHKTGLKQCIIASSTTTVYGIAYVVNIAVNGIGTWPESNDWYGFLNWGYAMGAVIFAGIVFVNFLIACLLGRPWSKK
ncbi:MAG: hypothetical protein K6G12_06305 [Lachnospiraceae bacterium]|nr:hypothetical protein [Lachnospiraceae bacterium]